MKTRHPVLISLSFFAAAMIFLSGLVRGDGEMDISSPAFKHNQTIPDKYTCRGRNINPPLTITNVPERAKSLVLIIDDPDAPSGEWVHWVVYNIPVTNRIAEGSVPGLQGMNDFERQNYGGPCPPSDTHHYFHKVYALDSMLNLKGFVNKQTVLRAAQGHILAKAVLVGLYSKGPR